MRNTLYIAKKELSWYFNSPVGYLLAAIFVVFGNFLYLRDFFLINQADLKSYFSLLPWLLLLLTAGLSMRMLSEEKAAGTLEILLTLPISETEIILGKFLAGLIFTAAALFFTSSLPLTLFFLGEPQIGVVFSGYLASLFLSGVFLSVGMFIGNFGKNQISALLTNLFFLFWLVFLGQDMVVSRFPGILASLFQYLGALSHFENLAGGDLNLRDLFYFVSVATGFLYLSVKTTGKRA